MLLHAFEFTISLTVKIVPENRFEKFHIFSSVISGIVFPVRSANCHIFSAALLLFINISQAQPGVLTKLYLLEGRVRCLICFVSSTMPSGLPRWC